MVTIYKYLLNDRETVVTLPEGAEMLSVHFQESYLYLWAKVNIMNPHKDRRIIACGTGHEIHTGDDKELIFIGSAHNRDGLVFHVFECVLL